MPEPEPRRRVPWGALVVGLVILGFLYLGLPEVQDPRSLLRPEMSDITEIDDLRESLG